MITILLAAITWVYLLEALKNVDWCPWLHHRSRVTLRLLNLCGALAIAIIWTHEQHVDVTEGVLVGWLALVVQQVTFDLIVRRSAQASRGQQW